jgi:hypothetical protein
MFHRRASRESQVQPGGAPPRLKVTRGPDGKLKVDEGPEGEPQIRPADEDTDEAAGRGGAPDGGEPRQG